MTCTDTAYIPHLSVNTFSLTRATEKEINMTPEEQHPVLNKRATILKFEERLDHGNDGSYILDSRLYAIPNDARETDFEGKKR